MPIAFWRTALPEKNLMSNLTNAAMIAVAGVVTGAVCALAEATMLKMLAIGAPRPSSAEAPAAATCGELKSDAIFGMWSTLIPKVADVFKFKILNMKTTRSSLFPQVAVAVAVGGAVGGAVGAFAGATMLKMAAMPAADDEGTTAAGDEATTAAEYNARQRAPNLATYEVYA